MTYPPQPPQYGQWQPQPVPPKKKRTGLIIGIVAGAVVVLGGGGAAAAVLISGNTPRGLATPQALQLAVTSAYNSGNIGEFDSLWCVTPSQADLDKFQQSLSRTPPGTTYSTPKPPDLAGSSLGSIDLVGRAGPVTVHQNVIIRQRDDNWCVDM